MLNSRHNRTAAAYLFNTSSTYFQSTLLCVAQIKASFIMTRVKFWVPIGRNYVITLITVAWSNQVRLASRLVVNSSELLTTAPTPSRAFRPKLCRQASLALFSCRKHESMDRSSAIYRECVSSPKFILQPMLQSAFNGNSFLYFSFRY